MEPNVVYVVVSHVIQAGEDQVIVASFRFRSDAQNFFERYARSLTQGERVDLLMIQSHRDAPPSTEVVGSATFGKD